MVSGSLCWVSVLLNSSEKMSGKGHLLSYFSLWVHYWHYCGDWFTGKSSRSTGWITAFSWLELFSSFSGNGKRTTSMCSWWWSRSMRPRTLRASRRHGFNPSRNRVFPISSQLEITSARFSRSRSGISRISVCGSGPHWSTWFSLVLSSEDSILWRKYLMNKEFFFAIISTVIYLMGAIPYWKDLIIWRTIPHIFTYVLWWILVGFNLFILIENREYYSSIPAWLMFASLTFWCFFGILRFQKILVNWFDWMCLGLWILLIGYWCVSRNSLNTVILTLILDCIAFLPTFKKWWIQPWTETVIMYFMSSIGQLATLLSLSWFDRIENALFWGYLFFANLIFFFMVILRRYYLKWWKSIFE